MGGGGKRPRRGGFMLLGWQYSTNNRPDLSDACTNSTYFLAGEIRTNLLRAAGGEISTHPKWGISGFGIYAFAEIINKPGKRKANRTVRIPSRGN